MTEMTEKELFIELDEEIRELLTLVHNIRIDRIIGDDPREKLEEALIKTQRIYAKLYSLYRGWKS